ncbi:uncharacterized protein LOC128550963 [Mercenaria mercenaria]|uniref:uncharacterized protein LOC128550963 n=1 Tax=Mercenaria mercenaria TaxID=6596 RepID=UPI00234EA397|nr:uncharacterized protein LOC128550963 [Mercenaria mercenaria]
MNTLDQRVKVMEAKVSEQENSKDFDSNNADFFKEKQKVIESLVSKLEASQEQQKKKEDEFQSTLLQMKAKDLQNNLMFYKVPEEKGETAVYANRKGLKEWTGGYYSWSSRLCKEVCSVEKITNSFGDTVYNVGCITQSLCHNTSFAHQGSDLVVCRECCQFDLCNAKGCGVSGYPQNRGPICYSCPMQTSPDTCHKIAFCEAGDVCKSDVMHEFGDTIYTIDCSRAHECKHNQQQGTAIIGRDVSNVKGKSDHVKPQRSLTDHVL